MQTIEGYDLAAKYLACLEPGEVATLAAWPEFASVNGTADWKHPLLLLTSKRLILVREKRFGKPSADFAITWPEVSRVSSGPWHGAFNPLIELEVQILRGALALAVQTAQAVDIESAIRAGYLSNPDHPANRRS